MVIRFTKPKNEDRPPTFTCIRDDGTTTGMPSTPFFVRHDLTHYAVETLLGFDDAFYGLLAKGWDLESFAERQLGSSKARQAPEQAALAEVVVGTLDLDWAAGPLPAEQSAEIIADKVGSPIVSPEQIQAIRAKRIELIGKWRDLEPGESLELTFPTSR